MAVQESTDVLVRHREALVVDASRRWTLDDLWGFPDDGLRREIIDGVLYVSPLARLRHQRVVIKFGRRLGEWEDVHGGQVYPGLNVDLPSGSHLEPDAVFLAPGNEVYDDALGITDAPDVAVEVSSPSTRRYDLGDKREEYARHGVGEFWFADLDEDAVLVFPGGRGEPRRFERGDVLTSDLLPGLELDVDDLLAP